MVYSCTLRFCGLVTAIWPHYIRHYGIVHGGGIYNPTYPPFALSHGFPTKDYFRVSCLVYQYVKGRLSSSEQERRPISLH